MKNVTTLLIILVTSSFVVAQPPQIVPLQPSVRPSPSMDSIIVAQPQTRPSRPVPEMPQQEPLDILVDAVDEVIEENQPAEEIGVLERTLGIAPIFESYTQMTYVSAVVFLMFYWLVGSWSASGCGHLPTDQTLYRVKIVSNISYAILAAFLTAGVASGTPLIFDWWTIGITVVLSALAKWYLNFCSNNEIEHDHEVYMRSHVHDYTSFKTM